MIVKLWSDYLGASEQLRMPQVRCVELLLRQRAPMTVEQLTILVHSLPTLDDPEVHASCMHHLPATEIHATCLCLIGLIGCLSAKEVV